MKTKQIISYITLTIILTFGITGLSLITHELTHYITLKNQLQPQYACISLTTPNPLNNTKPIAFVAFKNEPGASETQLYRYNEPIAIITQLLTSIALALISIKAIKNLIKP